MDARHDNLVEELVVRSTLSPSDTYMALRSLQRRGLVIEVADGRYGLSAEGARARADNSIGRAPSRGYPPLLLLADDVESTASDASDEDVTDALDRELGLRDRKSEG